MISWGEDSRNGFGLVKPNGLDTTKTDISCVNLIHLKSKIQGLSAGNSVVAFIRNNGRLVSVARIQEDQDGRRITGKLKSVTCKETIRALSCGDSHAVLLSEEGRVLCLDKANILRPLDNLYGQVFTWGQNTSGQLGLGWGESSAMSPKPLKSLSGIPLVQITAGGDHSFALSLSGAVFAWGKNTAGQLGLGDTTNRHAPAPVDCLNLKKTVLISCGGEHTAVLTKGGVVFTFGSGRYGQLGHNSLRDELQPRVVGQLWGSKVTQIACGRHHTLAFVGPSNKIYSFGHGEQGQLGNGVKIDQSVPLPVQLPDQIDERKIEQIFAGGNHSFALCTHGQESEERSNNLRSSVGKVTQQAIDEEIIDKWISECDSKSWKKGQKEITKMFSSASCLNGSFLDKSCDKHYQTSPKQSGLDLSLVRGAFRKLAKKDKVLTEVEAVVQHTLLPSLYEEPIGVEGLRVYLVLPELLRVLHKQHRRTDLTEAVAAAILRLHPDKLQVLGDCWSSLKPSVMTKHIGVWKKALSGILRSGHILRTRDPGIKHLLQVLGHLHRANQKSVETQTVPDSTFCMEEVHFNPIFLEEDVKFWRSWSKQDVDQTPAIFCHYPFLMNLQSKINVFNINAALTQNPPNNRQRTGMWPFDMFLMAAPAPFFELRLNRASLIKDTFHQLSVACPSTFKRFLVVYFDEDAKLTNVYKRDFFLHLFDKLLVPESGMFMYNDTETLAWFPAMPRVEEKRYFLFGVLCGMALYNNNMVHLPFPMAFFKKLVNIKPSLEDLREFSPIEAKSLQYILDYPDDDVENMDMTFSVMWGDVAVELDPKETGKLVTSANKKEFVDTYVNYIFNQSVEVVFEEFRKGFFKVCDKDVVEFFQPEELRGVMVGKEIFDWETLKQNTVYEGEYHAGHPNIVTFWEVFEDLTEDQKKAFLLFLTGCDRVPILGMNQIRMRVKTLPNSSQQHFPEALTCHSLLQLPIYPSKETLQSRLIEAVGHNRGFWNE
ncbi:probable E3 ubiquitin-protein ligase HERC3 isoform X2 [Salvelinus namaycush]|uniref:Probable E3 ubiquitin-protein ligase HERC3 isoform X2 n=1 Tax=Salvelinus namaycush TaxID=8040 RepID=A0A8U0R6H5_SALNM|nr:probable E3 ubiquitin-protein ligase HERC3 isoform X2 [Salvelinus namaycush]